MASEEVVTTIIDLVTVAMTYMIPIIAVMAGIIFVVSWFMSVTIGAGRRTFKG